MTTPRDLGRLAEAVKARRMQLHRSRLTAARAAGLSKDTWQRIEEGKAVWEVSYSKAEAALRWAPGSCLAVGDGGQPVEIETSDGSTMSQIPVEWLEGVVPGVVQSSAMTTTPGLTVREIHALSDAVAKALIERARKEMKGQEE
ncbi:helix-turn-helix domain-containing protein [Streptomyces uncialis]|uniref:helix-turn-helix domain-containing protein n=1 Tax=Streptomyces uncialis TaxID=1048205 RepID=UPI00381501C1